MSLPKGKGFIDNPVDGAAAVEEHLKNLMPRALDLLRHMVEINSFTANPQGVNELGALTAGAFAGLGFTAESVPSPNPLFGNHLVLTCHGRGAKGQPAPTIGLVSHLDTVFPVAEEESNDFRWREEGNRIYGPGTVDIKGGTVVIYMILSALRELAPDLFGAITWIVLLDASEETSSENFGRLCLARLSAASLACLVFEAGSFRKERFRLVVARKGLASFRVTVEGKAAHAGSSHQKGANAVVQMADIIKRIGRLTDYDRHLTYNVGTVAGGTVMNRVPHFASASVEMRAFDHDVFAQGLDKIMALEKVSTVGTVKGDFSCRVQVELLHQVAPWSRNAASDDLFRLWSETAVELGYRAAPQARGGLSDGNYLWADLPTLDGLGPAGGNAHCSERSADGSKDQEYVKVDSFVPKAMLNTMALIRLVREHHSQRSVT